MGSVLPQRLRVRLREARSPLAPPGRRRPVVGVAMAYALLLGAAACLLLRLMAIYRGWCAPLPPSPQDGDTDAPH